MREQAFLYARHVHLRKLQALRGVERDEGHAVLGAGRLVALVLALGAQREAVEKILEGLPAGTRRLEVAEDFAHGEAAARYFRRVEMPASNLANLFEMPVLYFALVPLLMLTRHAGHVQVTLAWLFVLLRALHSFIHIGPRKIRLRFFVYLASCILLSAMWIGFAIELAGAPA